MNLVADLEKVIDVGWDDFLFPYMIHDVQFLNEEQTYGFMCWHDNSKAVGWLVIEDMTNELAIQYFRVDENEGVAIPL